MKPNLVTISLFLFIITSLCYAQTDDNIDYESRVGIVEAKLLLAESGNVVRFPQPDNYDKTSIRSSDDNYQNLSPVWNLALTHDMDSMLITEVPLEFKCKVDAYIGLDNNSHMRGFVSTRLLIVKNVNKNRIGVYVWTNIGILHSGEKLSYYSYRYPGGSLEFTGNELLSGIEGNILRSHCHRAGVLKKVVLMAADGIDGELAYSIIPIKDISLEEVRYAEFCDRCNQYVLKIDGLCAQCQLTDLGGVRVVIKNP